MTEHQFEKIWEDLLNLTADLDLGKKNYDMLTTINMDIALLNAEIDTIDTTEEPEDQEEEYALIDLGYQFYRLRDRYF